MESVPMQSVEVTAMVCSSPLGICLVYMRILQIAEVRCLASVVAVMVS